MDTRAHFLKEKLGVGGCAAEKGGIGMEGERNKRRGIGSERKFEGASHCLKKQEKAQNSRARG